MNVETKFSIRGSDKGKINQDYVDYSPDKRIVAIADGLTHSTFQDIWAKQLVNRFIEKPFVPDLNAQKLKDWLEDIQKEWISKIAQVKPAKGTGDRSDAAKKEEQMLEEIIEISKDKGAESTLLGMIIQKTPKRQKLQLFGIGDTNMFLVRNNRIKEKFPVTSVKSFTNRTKALCSIDNPLQEIPELKEINAKKGDIVILATDALAKWILKSANLGQKPWKRILKNKKDIANFIDKLRKDQVQYEKGLARRFGIDDDDTTCIIIRI